MKNKSHRAQSIILKNHFPKKLISFKFIGKKIAFFIHKLLYNLIWLPMRIVFGFFFCYKVESQEDLRKLKGPLIIASNHASWLDSFLIGAAFPFCSKVFPIRFACWHRYYYKFQNILFLWLFGAFPIKKGIGLEKSLKIPVKILKERGVVGIFPEGRRYRGDGELKGRRGAAYLCFKTQAKILPVKIEGNINMSFGKFLLRRYKVKMRIGKAFSLNIPKAAKPEDLNEPTDIIMRKIKEL